MIDLTPIACVAVVVGVYAFAQTIDAKDISPRREKDFAVQMCLRTYGPATQPIYINNVLTCQSRRGEILEAK